MTLIPVNGVNVCELVFVPDMDVFNACLNFWTFYLSGGWTAVGISYKHYYHLLTVTNLFVA